MEWDPLAGPIHQPMLTPMPGSPTTGGVGGVAGEEAGVVVGVVASAGAGLHLTGTRGGKIAK